MNTSGISAEEKLVSTLSNRRRLLSFRSPVTCALSLGAFFLLFYNWRFWTETVHVMSSGTATDMFFLGSLLFVLLYVYAAFLLLIPGRKPFLVCVSVLCIVGALSAYSSDTYGIFVDKDMVRNLFETDEREATALLNMWFLMYLTVLGILPVVMVWRIKLTEIGLKKQILHRVAFVVGGLFLSMLFLFTFSAHYSSFVREHKSLRYLLSPAAAVQGTIQYVRAKTQGLEDDQIVDEDGMAFSLADHGKQKPLLLFLVVGETARGRNFQLGGYNRMTNPELSKLDNLYYFNNFTSCGTSTAISLPCMFSHLGHANFRVDVANHTTNLMDSLKKAQIAVEWRDNNSGSKGVSKRIQTINYSDQRDPTLCNQESCYDEIMLQGIEERVKVVRDDTVIVFHQIGSHGPAYAKRYPPPFERFKPVCRTNELKQCSEEEIHNAYDNSILYTDHNLATQIRLLQLYSDLFDTALIYVSDHGESLGEKGLYLHGAPFSFAPEDQTNVPFILWMSEAYKKRFSFQSTCLQAQQGKAFSHDNLYHTVLGAMMRRNAIYQDGMDMLATCRSNPLTELQVIGGQIAK